MSVAQLLRRAGGMQGISEQQQSVAREPFGGKNRGGSPAHRASADEGRAWIDLPSSARDNRLHARLEARHRVRPAAAFFPVKKVESDHVEAPFAQHAGESNHAAIHHVPARAVGANEYRLSILRKPGVVNSGGLVAFDSDAPSL